MRVVDLIDFWKNRMNAERHILNLARKDVELAQRRTDEALKRLNAAKEELAKLGWHE